MLLFGVANQRRCKQCNSPYQASRASQIYCNKTCNNRARKARQRAARIAAMPPKKCGACPMLLPPGGRQRHKQKFCCKHCNDTNQARIRMRVRHMRHNKHAARSACKICGGPLPVYVASGFGVGEAMRGRLRSVYCSEACSSQRDCKAGRLARLAAVSQPAVSGTDGAPC